MQISRKQAYVHSYASFCCKNREIHNSDNFHWRFWIPDKDSLFATVRCLNFQPNLRTGIEYGNKAFIFQSKKNKKNHRWQCSMKRKMLLYDIFPPL